MVWVGPGRSCESGSARAWADEGRGITECSHVTAGVLLVRIEPKGWWAGENFGRSVGGPAKTLLAAISDLCIFSQE